MINRLIVGNWKMNGSLSSNLHLLTQLKSQYKTIEGVRVVVCPSSPYLEQTKKLLSSSPIAWGAQNVCENDNGAFTGEISTTMLKDFSCEFCIIGHSERRILYGESDEMVAEKCAKLLKAGITPIVCIGETDVEREANETETVVLRQLKAVIDVVGINAFNKIVVAYEPVWAIGTGKTATPEMAEAVHKVLREHLIKLNADVAKVVPILYGGSMKGENAKSLLSMPNINGGLIGGAALKAEEFLVIVNA